MPKDPERDIGAADGPCRANSEFAKLAEDVDVDPWKEKIRMKWESTASAIGFHVSTYSSLWLPVLMARSSWTSSYSGANCVRRTLILDMEPRTR